VDRLSDEACQYLNKLVDFDHGQRNEDLYYVASTLINWEVVVPNLGLTTVHVHDIKMDHRGRSPEQRYLTSYTGT